MNGGHSRERVAVSADAAAGLAGALLFVTPACGASPEAFEATEARSATPCLVDPNNGWQSITGVLSRIIDGFGPYRVLGDPGSRSWDLAPECSIAADWESFIGKHVRVEGIAVLVRGGIGGLQGTALGVSRIELTTAARRGTWGSIRMIYR